MADDPEQVVDRLLERYGRTFAEELDIPLERGGAGALFRLLTGALLMSARIRSEIAVAAAHALFEHGCVDARRMAAASWQQRVDALGEGGYVRYDESTATYLGETAELVLDRYDGDLEGLRAAAEGDPRRIHALVQECKGIGQVGADIFCREVQRVWPELRPFADAPTLEIAKRVGLGSTPESLAELTGDDDLSTVAAALIRAAHADELEAVAGR